MKESERKSRPCAACGKPVGTATIVAGGKYPDAPICHDCFYDTTEAAITNRIERDRLAARLAEAEATLREMREALERIRDAGHENGNYCDVELADGRDCDCTRAIAEATLSRARERLGAK